MGNTSLDIDQYRHIYTEYAPMLMRFAEKFVSGFFAEDIVHEIVGQAGVPPSGE